MKKIVKNIFFTFFHKHFFTIFSQTFVKKVHCTQCILSTVYFLLMHACAGVGFQLNPVFTSCRHFGSEEAASARRMVNLRYIVKKFQIVAKNKALCKVLVVNQL